MKKLFILSVCFLAVLFYANYSFAATIDLNWISFEDVDGSGNVKEVIFTDNESVVTGTPQVYRLLLPELEKFGNIKAVFVSSLSDNLNVQGYASEALAIEAISHIFDMDVDVSFGTSLWGAGYYINKDNPVENSVYVLCTNNSATVTGDPIRFRLIIGRY